MAVIGLQANNASSNGNSSQSQAQKPLASLQPVSMFGVNFSATKLYQFDKDGQTPNAAHIKAVQVAREKAQARNIEIDSDGIQTVELKVEGPSTKVMRDALLEMKDFADIDKDVMASIIDEVRSRLPMPEFTVRLYGEKPQYDATDAGWS